MAFLRWTRRRILLGVVLFGCLAVPVEGAQVAVAWDPPDATVVGMDQTAVAGYRVYYGTVSRAYVHVVDAGMANGVTIRGLDRRRTYYFAVRAYDRAGLEGALSDEIVWTVDGDSDSMPDAWEREHFGGICTARAGAGEDFDGDGASNLQEFVAGTDPSDMSDLAVLRVNRRDGGVEISFLARDTRGPGYEGATRYYALERAGDPVGGDWVPVPGFQAVRGTEELHVFRVSAAEAAQGCFRTRIRLRHSP